MRCPGCGRAELAHVDLGERDLVSVESCPSCHGCWLGSEGLERIAAGVWSDVESLRLTAAQALSDVLCPRCAVQMVTLNPDDHRELALERCPTCHGFWLDSGELERLHDVAVEHVADHGALSARPDGWSHVRWIAYRLAERWRHIRQR